MVSTIHRSKGREFDNVFVILESAPETQEDIRCIYVALTRAKSNLYIGYNGEYFKPISQGIGKYILDSRVFPDPPKISLTLGLSEVYLGRFTQLQQHLKGLMPGDELQLADTDLLNRNGKAVLRFSKNFQLRLSTYRGRGFTLQYARINHIVYWWDPTAKKEVLAVLPEVVLAKE
jgi:ATP-dependent DNA helicase RecQ